MSKKHEGTGEGPIPILIMLVFILGITVLIGAVRAALARHWSDFWMLLLIAAIELVPSGAYLVMAFIRTE